jgi:hypothetical protein
VAVHPEGACIVGHQDIDAYLIGSFCHQTDTRSAHDDGYALGDFASKSFKDLAACKLFHFQSPF